MLLHFEKRLIFESYEQWQRPVLGQKVAISEAKTLAFLAAWQGWGRVGPNPLVGAVLLCKDGKLIGLGWHEQTHGGLHAEEAAIQDAIENGYQTLLQGGTAVVSLEPCSHHGRRPPCVDLLIKHGFAAVHYGLCDPDPRVDGRGIAILQAAGISCQVWEDGWQQILRQMLEIFLCNKTKSRAFISLKAGMSLDGSIAYKGDQRRFITGAKSRAFAHFLRLGHDGVMVGIGTLLADNPSLTVRSMKNSKALQKIIYDPDACFPELFADRAATLNFWQEATRVIFVTHVLSSDYEKKIMSLRVDGPSVEILTIAKADFSTLPRRFYELGIHSVLLEGGHLLYHDFLQHDLVDHSYLMMAPKIFLGGPRVFLTSQLGERNEWQATIEDFQRCGDDLIVSMCR